MRVLSQLRMKRRLVALAAAAALVLAAAGLAVGTTARGATTTGVTVALDWFPNPDHVALYYAKEKGYFEQHGVDPSFKTPSDPSAGLKLVATGRFDLAIYYEGDMFYAGQQGLPVIAVGALIPTPLNSMIAKAGSKVKTLADVAHASVGSAGLPFDGAVLQTVAQRLHIPSIKGVNVGFNLVPALLTGKVDAIVGGYWNIEAVEVKIKTGQQPVVFKMSQLGVPHFDELLVVANRDRLKSDSAYASRVRSFLAGLVEGIRAAPKDPAGSIAIMKKSSSYKQAELNGMVPLTLQALRTPTGLRTSCFSTSDWQSFGAWLLKNKLLGKPVAATSIETNAYLPGC